MDEFDIQDPGDHFTEISELSPEKEQEIDQIIDSYMADYQYISIGIVHQDLIVWVKSYNEDRRAKTDVYASVSKPVTAMKEEYPTMSASGKGGNWTWPLSPEQVFFTPPGATGSWVRCWKSGAISPFPNC